MIQTVQEGVEIYTKEVRKYLAFSDSRARGDSEERRLREWNEKLAGMQEVLGLTEKEMRQIHAEI